MIGWSTVIIMILIHLDDNNESNKDLYKINSKNSRDKREEIEMRIKNREKIQNGIRWFNDD